MKKIARLEDLTPDPRNANKGTERGAGMLEESLRRYGAGRSILVDKHGTVIAGNKTLEHAASMGLPVRVVDTDGHELVAVRRTDLDLNDKRAKELAVADNRVAQVNLDWNVDVLAELAEEADVNAFFHEDELKKLLDSQGEEDDNTCEMCPTCGRRLPKGEGGA